MSILKRFPLQMVYFLASLSVLLLIGCPQSESPAPAPAPAAGSVVDLGDQATAPEAAEPAAKEEAAAELVETPLGLTPVPVPEDNPVTAEKIELGKMLFFDKRLSGDNTLSCATCHNPKAGWTLHRANAVGIKDQEGDRNIPTIINAAYYEEHFWDGRAPGLEAQAVGPIQNPIEMGQSLDDLVKELSEVPAYVERFQKAFGTDVTKDAIAKALASFERTILGGNSPYDKFKAGDEKALNDIQKKGLELFESVGCSTCHTPPLFSNHRYYNAGVGMDKEKIDEGRKNVTKKDSDLGKFRVPEIRNVAETAPYFHDGSAETLEDAVALMGGGGKDNPNLSSMLKAVRDSKLTEDDRKALVEFLKTLTGDYPIVEAPELP